MANRTASLMRILILLAGMLATLPLYAQRPGDVPPIGSRVRVWEPRPHFGGDSIFDSHVGRLAALTLDTLSLQQFGSARPRRLAIDRVVRLEVSRGGTSRAAGAWRGAAFGSLILLALAAGVARQPEGDLGVALLAWYGTPIVVGGGALIGALSATGERWEAIPWPPPTPDR
jgi:hypothetical protein